MSLTINEVPQSTDDGILYLIDMYIEDTYFSVVIDNKIIYSNILFFCCTVCSVLLRESNK